MLVPQAQILSCQHSQFWSETSISVLVFWLHRLDQRYSQNCWLCSWMILTTSQYHLICINGSVCPCFEKGQRKILIFFHFIYFIVREAIGYTRLEYSSALNKC